MSIRTATIKCFVFVLFIAITITAFPPAREQARGAAASRSLPNPILSSGFVDSHQVIESGGSVDDPEGCSPPPPKLVSWSTDVIESGGSVDDPEGCSPPPPSVRLG